MLSQCMRLCCLIGLKRTGVGSNLVLACWTTIGIHNLLLQVKFVSIYTLRFLNFFSSPWFSDYEKNCKVCFEPPSLPPLSKVMMWLQSCRLSLYVWNYVRAIISNVLDCEIHFVHWWLSWTWQLLKGTPCNIWLILCQQFEACVSRMLWLQWRID